MDDLKRFLGPGTPCLASPHPPETRTEPLPTPRRPGKKGPKAQSRAPPQSRRRSHQLHECLRLLDEALPAGPAPLSRAHPQSRRIRSWTLQTKQQVLRFFAQRIFSTLSGRATPVAQDNQRRSKRRRRTEIERKHWTKQNKTNHNITNQSGTCQRRHSDLFKTSQSRFAPLLTQLARHRTFSAASPPFPTLSVLAYLDANCRNASLAISHGA